MKPQIKNHFKGLTLCAGLIALAMPAYAAITMSSAAVGSSTNFPAASITTTNGNRSFSDVLTTPAGATIAGGGIETRWTTNGVAWGEVFKWSGSNGIVLSACSLIVNSISTGSYQPFLFDIGAVTFNTTSSTFNPSSFANRLSSVTLTPAAISSQSFLEFNFSGSDAVTLTNGHSYAFGLLNKSTGNINVQRNNGVTSDPNGAPFQILSGGLSGTSATVPPYGSGVRNLFIGVYTTSGSPPAAPTGLAAVSGNAQVSLSWTASSGATSYNVKRATTSGGPYTTIASVTTASYVNTGLVNGTTYYFVVSALNANGESPNSSQVSAAPVAPIPAAPAGLTAAAGNTQVSLSWTASTYATSYNVKRATTSGGPYTTITSVTMTSYVNTGLANGTTYYFVVSAVNTSGESPNSSQVSATPSAGSTPPFVYSIENTGTNFPPPPLPTLANCPLIQPLPDPFYWAADPYNFGGTGSTNFSDWEHHRNEIAAQIQNYEVGTKPAVNIPSQVTASYSGGTLTVHVTANGQTMTLTCAVSIPSGSTAPYPVCIGMDSSYGSLNSSDFTSRHIVGVTYSESQVSTYGSPSATDPFYKLYPSLWGNQSGQYSAWAWGVSRVIDGLTLVTNVLPVDLKHLAVTGCSYAGKLALYSGAYDERVALTIAQESGGGGDTSWRYSHTMPAGSVEDIDNTDYNWFANVLQQFSGNNVSFLPDDHHELMAMVAPRALYCTANTVYGWLSNPSAYICGEACGQVYKTFGISDRFGYNVDGGHSHCAFPSDQEADVQYFLNKFILGQTNLSQTIRTFPNGFTSTNNAPAWYGWWGTTNAILH